MIIYSYLARRFLLYCIAITTLLTFLYNFVEFFEKMLRVKHTNISTILYFLQLNTLPAFIDYLPLGAWLSSALLLKELFSRNEWDVLQFITFVPRRLIIFFASMGFILVVFAFILNEGFVASIAFKTESFKQEKFKQNSVQTIINQWFELGQGKIFYGGVIEVQSGTCTDGIIIEMDPETLAIKQIIKIPIFTLNVDQQTLGFETAKVFEIETSCERILSEKTLFVPALFSQIRIHNQPLRVFSVIRSLLYNRQSLPSSAYKALINKLCKRLEYYIQLFMYPVLSIFLFLICMPYDYMRWIALLCTYPLMMSLGLFTDLLMAKGTLLFGIFIIYFIIVVMLMIVVLKLRVLS